MIPAYLTPYIRVPKALAQECGRERVGAYFHAASLVKSATSLEIVRGQPCCYILYDEEYGSYYVGSTLDLYRRYTKAARRNIKAVFYYDLDRLVGKGWHYGDMRRDYLLRKEEDLRRACSAMGMRLSNRNVCYNYLDREMYWLERYLRR